jgi:hypothetical protein
MWIQDPDGIHIVLAGFLPITRCAATRDRRHRHDDELHAACECVLLAFGSVCPEADQAAEVLHDRRHDSIVCERALDFVA